MRLHIEENDKRRLHRHDIHGVIEAIDQGTDKVIGYLLNVHSEGVLLHCDAPVELNQGFQLRLAASKGKLELPWMEIKVECRWVGETDNEAGYQVGCQILEASEEALAVLQQLDL